MVTGDGNGIGKACCEMLAAYGANVVVSDCMIEPANKVVEEITLKGGKAIALECNVTKDEALVNLVEKTLEAYGQINILVNNVGGGGDGRESPYEISVNEFERFFQMNFFSMWRLCQLVAPHMKSSGYGSIINMSSMV
ncbi:SDR family NAD(P)-dependent oxidoreductase [Empedobacter falsenii]|uniref:SDR family NAD(P)-dependent oxidoreductase n=2 Tax=Weeksellaceae TaxID=2762318 RepID=A0A3R8TWQ2_9FLAO|nr:SDR family NAD(P)-dependent oxidoreductase [Empedobacter falsenii]RRT91663.1 SDR family NAD(P)-dependent oxidoreductase [Empedobacter falsenii]